MLQLNKEGGRAVTAQPGVDILDGMWWGQMHAHNSSRETAASTFAQFPTEEPFVTNAMRKITGNGQVLIMTAVGDQATDYTVRLFGVIMLRLP